MKMDQTLRAHLASRKKFDDEGIPTATSEAQKEVEKIVEDVYLEYSLSKEAVVNPNFPELRKEQHISYLEKTLSSLSSYFEKLDVSRAWFCYWTLHPLALLHHEVDRSKKKAVIHFLKLCQAPDGGFGGGPMQYPHLATTYASVNALVILGTTEAYKAVDRAALTKFLWSLRVGDGSFYMHEGGEIDVRSVYCALTVAKILNIYSDKLFENTVDWLVRCQSYEGGFSGEPGMEAHGGYTFCAVAALVLLNSYHRCDIQSLLRWTVNRQIPFEGGFQGRTNKLVDSCYSFWQGASLAMANMALLTEEGIDRPKCDSWLFDNRLLQEYVLICCQHAQGGFHDKPHVNRDAYHTCYAMSGVSIAQNVPRGKGEDISGGDNILDRVHPAYNLPMDKLADAFNYFYNTFVEEPS
ncbi:protein farnesyltransferase subunit beta [Cimex lectularius]|uniref:Protein farnesyltransferase subunit beta n=1 Tax=Cimex lectularius TaxID=79782 RepID=A0A8I6RP62_CIMLE|nr:protein farnesyltransferase subunit beta [Cimex lectularius]